MKKSTKKIIGWIISIVVAIIGSVSTTHYFMSKNIIETSTSINNSNEQKQSITINIDGKEVTINPDNAQKIYGKMEDDNNKLSAQVETLEDKNASLSTELARYKEYGTAALVSKNKDYDSDKVSLLAFETVNENDWDPNEGTLKDSLGNTYTVNLDYVILNNGQYGEFYTNNKFSKLQFKLAPHETMSQDCSAVIKVFSNDRLLFTSDEITRKTPIETYTIDISNTEFIKIICERIEGWGNSNVLCLDSSLIK